MFRRLSIGLFVATLSLPLSIAQMRGAMGRPVSGAHAGFARGFTRGIGPRRGARSFGRGILLSSPFFEDYDGPYSDVAESYAIEGAAPQVVVVQPRSADDSPRKTKPGPLLIEWQGDRYVRFGGTDASEEPGSAHPDYAEPLITKKPASAPQKELPKSPAAELPPAVLVYRDGDREEIADYTIADGVICVHGTDWQSGYWTKRIPLTALDPVATIRANQERGVRFLLPSAPNVVIASF